MKTTTFSMAMVVVMLFLGSGAWAKVMQLASSAGRQSSAGRIAIVGYKPKPGKADALKKLARTHVQRLRAEGLVTDREPVIMEAIDGTVIEVFEWKSKVALEAAHKNATVQAMWKEYAEVCDYIPVASVAETRQLFSEFSPLE